VPITWFLPDAALEALEPVPPADEDESEPIEPDDPLEPDPIDPDPGDDDDPVEPLPRPLDPPLELDGSDDPLLEPLLDCPIAGSATSRLAMPSPATTPFLTFMRFPSRLLR
jgi:hypothetical protein